MALRSKKISKKLYNDIIRQERKTAKKYGYDIKFFKKSFSWKKAKEFKLFSDVCGEFDTTKKKIYIRITGRPGHGRIIGTLYHEMRHLEHYMKDLFHDYYHNNTEKALNILFSEEENRVPLRFKIPCLKTAHLAEVDCSVTAKKRLLKLGVLYDTKYPWKNTASYRIMMRVWIVYLEKIKILVRGNCVGIELKILKREIIRIEKMLIKAKFNHRISLSDCSVTIHDIRISIYEKK